MMWRQRPSGGGALSCHRGEYAERDYRPDGLHRGAFSRVYDLLVEAMQPILHHRGPELHRQGLRIEPAVFLADTSLMGAAALVFEHRLGEVTRKVEVNGMRTKPVNVVYRWETSCPEPISLGYREMAEKIAGLLGQGTL